MVAYQLDAFNPGPVDLMLYAQCLANSRKMIGTIKNYLSGARSFILERGSVLLASFAHPMLATFVKGLEKNIAAPPTQAITVPPRVIVAACDYLRNTSAEGVIVTGIILFLYATMLRQGHVLHMPHGEAHVITRGDLFFEQGSMLVLVKSSKTTTKANQSVIPVLSVNDLTVCLVNACRDAMALTPAGSISPVFLDPRMHLMLTPRRATALWREALLMVGFRQAPAATLHSLRRAGAHTCANEGVDIQHIKDHGMWRSAAVKKFVTICTCTRF